jgi:hypothetical protein
VCLSEHLAVRPDEKAQQMQTSKHAHLEEDFPTEARLRAKETCAIQQAIDPDHGEQTRKRKVSVEEHYDDCGEDSSSLDRQLAKAARLSRPDRRPSNLAVGFSLLNGFFGSGMDDTELLSLPVTRSYNDFDAFVIDWLSQLRRVRHFVLIRRQHFANAGRNFDITVGVDLFGQRQLKAFWRYVTCVTEFVGLFQYHAQVWQDGATSTVSSTLVAGRTQWKHQSH